MTGARGLQRGGRRTFREEKAALLTMRRAKPVRRSSVGPGLRVAEERDSAASASPSLRHEWGAVGKLFCENVCFGRKADVSSGVMTQCFYDQGKCGRLLPAAGIIQMIAGVRLTPVIEHAQQPS